MCGRYTIIKRDQITRVFFNVTIPANLRLIARYNVAPSQLIPVIANNSPELQLFQWGLIPSWTKNPALASKPINARAETLMEKNAFRNALIHRRCLIPADGFYEWRKESDGKTKTPMYITIGGGQLFAFAGLWETWQNPTGQPLNTCTIITTAPNQFMRTIHDRMPAILPPEAQERWLSPAETTPDNLLPLLLPYPSTDMAAHPVSRLVNAPKNEGPQLIAPVSPPATLF